MSDANLKETYASQIIKPIANDRFKKIKKVLRKKDGREGKTDTSPTGSN